MVKYTKLACIDRTIFDTHEAGSRNIIARQYAIACRKDGILREALFKHDVPSFYNRCDKTDFSYQELERCVNWVYKQKKEDLFLNCNTMKKCGYCNEEDEKNCILYHYRKIRSSEKKLIKYVKNSSPYKNKRGWGWVGFQQIKQTAPEHQKTIKSIFLNDLGSQTATNPHTGEPASIIVVKEEQLDKLEKKLDIYADIYAEKIEKQEVKRRRAEEWRRERQEEWRRRAEERERKRAEEWKRKREEERRRRAEEWEREREAVEAQKRPEKPIKREAAQPQKKAPIEKPKNRGGRPRKKIDKEKIFQLRREGKSMGEIAKQLKISKTSVHRILKEG